MAVLNDLDHKLLEHFRGYVVKKDLVRMVKVGANVLGICIGIFDC